MAKDLIASFLSFKPNPKFLEAVGRVTVEFAKLEAELSGFIVVLLDKPDTEFGPIVTSELSFKQLVQLLMSLYQHANSKEDQIVELKAILTKCSSLEIQRNTIIHSEWTSAEMWNWARRRKVTSKFKKGLHKEDERVGIDELKNLAEDIHSVMIIISKLSFKWLVEHRPAT